MRGLLGLLALAIPAAASAADADGPGRFTGAWHGKGTYILNGDMMQCGVFELAFASEGEKFVFVSGRRLCERHEESFTAVEMQVKDGFLLYNGQKIGTYGDGLMQAAFRQPEGDGRFRNWRMSMRREGNHLVYEESRRMDEAETPMISFAGMLVLGPD